MKVSTTSNHQVHLLTLLDTDVNSSFLDKDFARLHRVTLRKLHCPTSIVIIEGHIIPSGNIVEEFELVPVVRDNLACIISFNIISSPKHPLF